VQYGLTLRAKPDSKAKAIFAKWIELALQNTREQRPGIEIPDAIYFNSRLENGADIMELEEEMRYTIEKNKQDAERQQMAVIEAQDNRICKLNKQTIKPPCSYNRQMLKLNNRKKH